MSKGEQCLLRKKIINDMECQHNYMNCNCDLEELDAVIKDFMNEVKENNFQRFKFNQRGNLYFRIR